MAGGYDVILPAFILLVGAIFLVTPELTKEENETGPEGHRVMVLLKEQCYQPRLNVSRLEKLATEFLDSENKTDKNLTVGFLPKAVVCDSSHGLAPLLETLSNPATSALIGSLEPELCDVAVKLATLHAKQLLTWSCPHTANNNNFVRLGPSLTSSAEALVQVFKHFRWKTAAILTTDLSYWPKLAHTLDVALRAEGLVVKHHVVVEESSLRRVLSSSPLQPLHHSPTRVIVLCLPLWSTLTFDLLRSMHLLNLTRAPATTLLGIHLSSVLAFLPPSSSNQSGADRATRPPSADLEGRAGAGRPWTPPANVSDSLLVLSSVNPVVDLEGMLRRQGGNYDVTDELWLRISLGLAVVGSHHVDRAPPRSCAADDCASRLRFLLVDWTETRWRPVMQLDAVNGSRFSVRSFVQDLKDWQGVKHGTGHRSLEPADPVGCDEEECDDSIRGVEWLSKSANIATIAICSALMATGIIALGFLIRRQVLRKRMFKGPYKILLTPTDFVFPQVPDTLRVDEGMEAMLCCWLQQLQEFGGPEVDKPDLIKGSLGSLKSLRSHQQMKLTGSNTSLSRNIIIPKARYNGDLVQMKEIPTSSQGIELRSKAMAVLTTMHGLRHENINPFLGVLVTSHSALVLEWCSRGSLEDVLVQDEIKLDWSFRLSLLTDLVRGMKYLHTCPLRIHGNLTSRNCVIDARWVLKITDYGLPAFYEAQNISPPRKTARVWKSATDMRRTYSFIDRGSYGPKDDTKRTARTPLPSTSMTSSLANVKMTSAKLTSQRPKMVTPFTKITRPVSKTTDVRFTKVTSSDPKMATTITKVTSSYPKMATTIARVTSSDPKMVKKVAKPSMKMTPHVPKGMFSYNRLSSVLDDALGNARPTSAVPKRVLRQTMVSTATMKKELKLAKVTSPDTKQAQLLINPKSPAATTLSSSKLTSTSKKSVSPSTATASIATTVTSPRAVAPSKSVASGEGQGRQSVSGREMKNSTKGKEVPKELESPFTWGLEEFVPSGKLSEEDFLREKLEKRVFYQDEWDEGDSQWRILILSLVLCFESCRRGEATQSSSFVEECETIVTSPGDTEVPIAENGDAFAYVLRSCRYHLAKTVEARRKILVAFPAKAGLSDQVSAGLLGIRAAVTMECGPHALATSLPLLEQALTRAPDSCQWRLLLAECLERRRRLGQGVCSVDREHCLLEEVVWLSGEPAHLVRLGGACRLAAANHEQSGAEPQHIREAHRLNLRAALAYRQAARDAPYNACVLIRCAEGLSGLPPAHQDMTRAYDLARRAHELAPHNPTVSHLWGRINAVMGFEEKGMRFLKAAADTGHFQAQLDMLASRTRQDPKYDPTPELEAMLDACSSSDRRQEVLAQLCSHLLFVAGDVGGAERWCRRLLDLDPRSPALTRHRRLSQLDVEVDLLREMVTRGVSCGQHHPEGLKSPPTVRQELSERLRAVTERERLLSERPMADKSSDSGEDRRLSRGKPPAHERSRSWNWKEGPWTARESADGWRPSAARLSDYGGVPRELVHRVSSPLPRFLHGREM